jgi:CheY-like chemotaxis protein
MDRNAPPLALLVDDEAVVRMEMCDLLIDAGFDVVEAWSTATALDQLARHPDISLLFTDVNMPGPLNGFALARAVAVSWPEIRIVVASGVSRPAAQDMPVGARFIDKPFSPRLVVETVREVRAD